jgi:hypothetical protein
MINTVTEQSINDLILLEDYWENGKTTVCILTLKNNFEVVGTSAPVDKSNFDKKVGRKYAREKAINKLWELEGYRLQWELFNK